MPDSVQRKTNGPAGGEVAECAACAVRQENARLRESERLRRDLTDMVIHDLKVPLTNIIGSIHTFMDVSDPAMSSEQIELLKMAISSSDTMLQMISDLLDVSKFEEHKLTLRKRPASMEEVVEDAVTQVLILAGRKKQSIQVDVCSDLPPVHIDRERILRVLVNLLSNAIRHTPQGDSILVRGLLDPDGKAIRVSVKDNGEGIPAEYRGRIFDKFVQAETHKSRKCTSTGLGLTFCKLATEAHGGDIWVESTPGKGSTFTFTLPLS